MKKSIFMASLLLVANLYAVQEGVSAPKDRNVYEFKYFIDSGVQAVYLLNKNEFAVQLVFNFFQEDELKSEPNRFDYRNRGHLIINAKKHKCIKEGQNINCYNEDESKKVFEIMATKYDSTNPQNSTYCIQTNKNCVPLIKAYEQKAVFVKHYDIKYTDEAEGFITKEDLYYTGPYKNLENFKTKCLNQGEHDSGYNSVYFYDADTIIKDRVGYMNTKGSSNGDRRDIWLVKDGKDIDDKMLFIDRMAFAISFVEKGIVDSIDAGMHIMQFYPFGGKLYRYWRDDYDFKDPVEVKYEFVKDHLSQEGKKYIYR